MSSDFYIFYREKHFQYLSSITILVNLRIRQHLDKKQEVNGNTYLYITFQISYKNYVDKDFKSIAV